jgi:hypothetical protein
MLPTLPLSDEQSNIISSHSVLEQIVLNKTKWFSKYICKLIMGINIT